MYRERMYSADEVRRMLRRAAEVQENDGASAPKDAAPLTFDQIVKLAQDAGIAEESVRRAATEAPSAKSSPRKPLSFAGAPTKLGMERTVRGYVGPSNHAQLVRAMRRALGESGNAQVLGDSLSWSTTQAGRQVSISIEPDGEGRVTVRIDENMKQLAGGLFGGMLGGVGGGGLGFVIPLAASHLHAAALTPIVVLAWLAIVYLIVREMFVARVRAREQELSSLLDGLADRVHGAARPAEPRARVSTSPPRAEDERRAAEEEAALEEIEAADRRGGSRSA